MADQSPEPSKEIIQNPKQARSFLWMGVACLVVAVGLTIYLLESGQSHQFVARFLLITVVALAASIMLFGFLRSYAVYSTKAMGKTLSLGGPAAFFIVVFGFFTAFWEGDPPPEKEYVSLRYMIDGVALVNQDVGFILNYNGQDATRPAITQQGIQRVQLTRIHGKDSFSLTDLNPDDRLSLANPKARYAFREEVIEVVLLQQAIEYQVTVKHQDGRLMRKGSLRLPQWADSVPINTGVASFTIPADKEKVLSHLLLAVTDHRLAVDSFSLSQTSLNLTLQPDATPPPPVDPVRRPYFHISALYHDQTLIDLIEEATGLNYRASSGMLITFKPRGQVIDHIDANQCKYEGYINILAGNRTLVTDIPCDLDAMVCDSETDFARQILASLLDYREDSKYYFESL